MGSLSDHHSDGDTDISDSDMDDYEDKSYEELKSGNHQVKVSDEAFACPYCPKKRKRDYQYNELLQHASGVGKSSSDKRSAKEKASHLALAKYLTEDLSDVAGPSKLVDEGKAPIDCSHDDKFVWPWKGVVMNIPTRRAEDGRYVGESGSKLRDELTKRGFNPTRVSPLWNYRGHSGSAVVEFNKGWPGLHNAMSFEKAYEVDHHGRKDWFVEGTQKIGLYAWVARANDYNSNSIVGEHLRKIGDLKTIPEIIDEEARKQDRLVSNLTNIIESKNKYMLEIEEMCNETSKSLNVIMTEKDKLHQAYDEELRKIQTSAHGHYRRIFGDHEKLKSQLESLKKDLEVRGQELEKREAHNESERKKLSDEIAENAQKNNSLELAALEQQRVDVKVYKLAEDQKREKEKLHNRIIQLEKQLDAKQALELEIEQLKGSVNVMTYMEDEDDAEILKKVDILRSDLKEKEGDLEDLVALNQTLTVKERNSNDELQEARKELINVLKDICSGSHIGVKRMGELDKKPFLEAMKLKYNEEDAEEKASELCSLWDDYLRDPSWHPFKIIQVEGKDKNIIDDQDEKLNALKREMGDSVYEAVSAALMEVNEYNPSGGYAISELWNYKERRKASLKEGIDVLLTLWNAPKSRRGMS